MVRRFPEAIDINGIQIGVKLNLYVVVQASRFAEVALQRSHFVLKPRVVLLEFTDASQVDYGRGCAAGMVVTV